MSYGGLPFWVFQAIYEQDLAEMKCCFQDEWFAGTSMVLPSDLIDMSKATFKTHDAGGWNYDAESQKTTR
jgi:hypothetical protein